MGRVEEEEEEEEGLWSWKKKKKKKKRSKVGREVSKARTKNRKKENKRCA